MPRIALVLLSGSALAFSVSPVLAQTVDSSGPNAAAPADAAPSDQEITVTATRRAEKLSDVPFTVTALSSDQLTTGGVVSLKSLSQLVPGLVWNGLGAWAQPSLRGVSTTVATPGSGSPIAIYLDGVYQPQQISTVTDLPDIRSIEVAKGPQGTLFGRNATAGAIQINTLDPEFTSSGKFSVQAGQYFGGRSHSSAHLLAKGFITGPVSDNVALSLSAFGDYTPGYLRNVATGGRLGKMQSATVRGKMLWTPDDKTDVLLTAYYATRDDRAAENPSVYRGLSAIVLYPDAVYGDQPWEATQGPTNVTYFRLNTIGASLRISREIEGLGKITSTTGFNRYRPKVRTNTCGGVSQLAYNAFACLDYIANHPETAFSQEIILVSDQLGRVQFTSGLFGFISKSQGLNIVNGGALYYADSDHHNYAAAAFFEGNYKATDRLTLTAGVRANYDKLTAKGSLFHTPFQKFADKSWFNLTPRISAKYAVNDDVNVYATYSQGFKAGVAATDITTAPPADPEILKSYEAGLKYASGSQSFNLAFFYYDYKKLQHEFNYGLFVAPGNTGRSTLYGVDIDAAVQLTPEFRLSGGATWLPRARYDKWTDAIATVPPLGPYGLVTVSPYDASGSRMLTAPKLTLSVTGDYSQEIPIGKIQASANFYYSSAARFEVTGRARQPAYAQVNAQVGLVPASAENLRIGAYVRNLTNKAVINGIQLPAGAWVAYYTPPREVGVSLEYKY